MLVESEKIIDSFDSKEDFVRVIRFQAILS